MRGSLLTAYEVWMLATWGRRGDEVSCKRTEVGNKVAEEDDRNMGGKDRKNISESVMVNSIPAPGCT